MTDTDDKTIPVIEGAGGLLPDYLALIVDLWGVVHNGKAAYEQAVAALTRYRREVGGTVALLSNAPRPAAAVAEMLERLKVPTTAYDTILTSGDLTRLEIADGDWGQVFVHLGPERDRGVFDGLPLVEGDIDTANFILNTGLFDDDTETPEDYRDLFQVGLSRDMPMVCANPDIKVMRGDDHIWCAGALAALYEEMGGRVLIYGKPHAPTYKAVLRELGMKAGFPLNKSDVLAIGDGLKTDILGANQAGIDALLIAGGIHAAELGYSGVGQLDHTSMNDAMRAAGLDAVAAMTQLSW